MLFIFHVATLEINATGVVFGKDLLKENWEFISLISEKKPKNIMLESGKLLSELAPKYICIYFDQMIYS